MLEQMQTIFFFCVGQDLNLRPYIYYALSLLIELSLQKQTNILFNCGKGIKLEGKAPTKFGK